MTPVHVMMQYPLMTFRQPPYISGPNERATSRFNAINSTHFQATSKLGHDQRSRSEPNTVDTWSVSHTRDIGRMKNHYDNGLVAVLLRNQNIAVP